MVAVAIMAIAFTAVIKVHSQTISMNMASNFYIKAPLLATKIISEWESSMATSGSAPASEPLGDEFAGFAYTTDQQPITVDALFSEKADKNSSRLVQLNCTITYNEGEFSYTIKSLKLIAQ